MKIGIIGSGNMGRALGIRFAHASHEVLFGSRRLEQAKAAASKAPNAAYGDIYQAVDFGELLVWTVRDTSLAQEIGAKRLSGKIIVDLNNSDFAKEFKLGAFRKAIAEQLQETLPHSFVVKAFNTIPLEVLDIPVEVLRLSDAQIFIAGASSQAKQAVSALANEIGFRSIDVGSDLISLRAVESLADVVRLIMIEGKQSVYSHIMVTKLPAVSAGLIGEREPSKYT